MLGYGTAVVNGQRVPTQTNDAWQPVGWAGSVQAAPGNLNTLPPALGAGGIMGGVSTGAMQSVGGYGTADNNAAATVIAGNQPFSFVHSPLPLAMIGFIGALLVLKFVFWRKGDSLA